MTDEINIGGRSRRFQLAVLITAIVVLFTALLAVGSIASSSGDFGLGIEDENVEDSDGFFELFAGSEDSTGEDDGVGSGDREEGDRSGVHEEPDEIRDNGGDGITEWVSDGDGELRDLLNADNTDTELPNRHGNDALEDQLSPDSFRSFLGETHFSVSSERDTPTFWRTTTYDTYTGDSVLDSNPPVPGETIPLEEYNPETRSDTPTETDIFTLQKEASRIPVAGDPLDVSIRSGANPAEYEFERGEDGAIIITDGEGNINPLPEGTQIEITAVDDGRLAGGDAPDENGQYTDTPNDLPDRVGEHAKGITQSTEAESNEEKADAITSWVQSNREYRADQAHDESGDAVDQFLFEMGGGDSLQFATSTTMLLREEGVPARIATGYADNDPGDDSDLGSMDQHAWVEVYTEDHGWVVYDPTPSEKDTAKDGVQKGEESVVEYGVHDDVIEGWKNDDENITGGSDDSADTVSLEDGDPSENPSPPYDITIAPEPTPGASVTVFVTSDDVGIHGAEVKFNGEYVGTTGPDGALSTHAPYSTSLTVTAEPPSDDGNEDSSPQGSIQFSGAGSIGGSFTSTTENQSEPSSEKTYDLPTELTVDSDRLLLPGETINTTFTIDEIPVPDVDVFVNGDHVGTTNYHGEIEIVIPEDAEPGDEITVHVERDELMTDTTISIAEPEIRVDGGVIMLPGTSADVTVVATDGEAEQPLSNQSIHLVDGDGNPIADTEEITVGEDGSTSITIPWSNSMTASTTFYGIESTTTIDGLFYRVGGVILAAILGAAGVIIGLTRRGVTARLIQERFYKVLFTVAETAHSVVERVYTTGVRLYQRLLRYGAGLKKWILSPDLSQLKELPRNMIVKVAIFLSTIPDHLRAMLSQSHEGSISENPPETTVSSQASQTTDSSASERIRQCWRWLVRYVMERGSRTTKTTVEIGDAAIERGFPAGPVRRLRRAFQDIEYGFKDGESQVDDAENAVETLREDTNGDVESAQ